MDFNRAIAFTLGAEGGLADHASDRGGRTRFGISSRSHPDVDVDSLTLDQARELYRDRYWRSIRGDDLPWPLALVVFDHAVHASPPSAVRALQLRAGAVVDGIIGPKTLAAVGRRPVAALSRELLHARATALTAQIRSDPSQLDFLGGWWSRLIDLAVEVGRS